MSNCPCSQTGTPSRTWSHHEEHPATPTRRFVVALAGNPNAGKTTLFNALTGARAHVGNWPGKTVEKKEGLLRVGGLEFEIVDLPGVYSLSAFSPEEVIARDYILQCRPDLVVNVVDAGNLERNLYLTVQLLELGVPLLLVLNQIDMARTAGMKIDQAQLGALLGHVPVVETVGNREQGIAGLVATMAQLVQRGAISRNNPSQNNPSPALPQGGGSRGVFAINGRDNVRLAEPQSSPPWGGDRGGLFEHASPLNLADMRGGCYEHAFHLHDFHLHDFHLHYGDELQTEVAQLAPLLARQLPPASPLRVYPPRWVALKLLEADPDLVARMAQVPAGASILAQVDQAAARIEACYGDSADIALADARYGFVHGVAHQVVQRHPTQRHDLTSRNDRIVAHRILGLPLFFVVMYIMFKLVVDVSAPFLDWMDGVIHGPITRWASHLLTAVAAPGWLHSLLTDGIIAGVGGVRVFLPGLFVLYLFLTFLEDSGYMARIAFLMDKLMSFTGLQGKSFIPLILGFGCAVPAIYATRTLENERDRIATGLLVPLMSCSARLPVYVVFGMAFFPDAAGLLITGLYAAGIVIAAGVGWLFSRTLFRHSPRALFALELPPYRLPTLKGLWLHTWEKSKEFVYKAGTVILGVSVLLWLLTNLPWGVAEARTSYYGRASAALAPLFAPAGFGTWEASGALVTGFIAKEVVVSTMAQVYLGAEAETGTAQAGTAETWAMPTIGEDLGAILSSLVVATLDAGRSLVSLLPGIDLMGAPEATDDLGLGGILGKHFTPLAALAFLVFVLVYTPCVATLGAMRTEYGWRWLGVSATYQFVLAWGLAVLVYQGGRFLGWG